MKHKSIFVKLLLFILPLVLIADGAVLSLTYYLTYQLSMQQTKELLQSVGEETARYFEYFDPDEPGDLANSNWYLDSVCALTDVAYVYNITPNAEDNSVKYNSIGFGEDATVEARQKHYSGAVIQNAAHPEEFDAMNGKLTGNIREDHNIYGDMLVCYVPVTRHYDVKTEKMVENDIKSIIGVETSVSEMIYSIRMRFATIALFMIISTVMIVLGVIAYAYQKIGVPAREISRRMSEYVANRENEKHEEKLVVKGNDEFAQMAESFNTMTDEIDRYIDDIEELTLEKHTSEAELNIARRIQMGLLQPKSMSGSGYDISALVRPAKDVGGDLYDYQLLDDGRVFISIADVSGKGISASLFMSRAITLLHQYALMDYSPAQMLEKFNDMLASRNPGGMFITTFVAFYDPSTAELTYSNAGHNFPYILSDSLIKIEDAHGMAAGLFSGEEYENATIQIKHGDILFLFTDGVNEAKDKNGRFYTTERLEEELTACVGVKNADPLTTVLDSVQHFAEGATQNDDITILTLRMNPCENEVVLHLNSELKELNTIKEAIRNLDVSDTMKHNLHLAAEEIFVNICSYAYDADGEAEVRFAVTDRVEMTFTDRGKPFDPTANVLEIDNYDHEHAIGGLGRFLVFSIADEARYDYINGRNILHLYFDPNKEAD